MRRSEAEKQRSEYSEKGYRHCAAVQSPGGALARESGKG